jgi:hypothetical protein
MAQTKQEIQQQYYLLKIKYQNLLEDKNTTSNASHLIEAYSCEPQTIWKNY